MKSLVLILCVLGFAGAVQADAKKLTCNDVIVSLVPAKAGTMAIKVTGVKGAGEISQDLGTQCFQQQFCTNPVASAKALCADIAGAKVQTEFVTAKQFQTQLKIDEIRGDNYKERAARP